MSAGANCTGFDRQALSCLESGGAEHGILTSSSRLRLAIFCLAVLLLVIQKSQAQNTLLQYRVLELSWSTTASFTLLPELENTQHNTLAWTLYRPRQIIVGGRFEGRNGSEIPNWVTKHQLRYPSRYQFKITWKKHVQCYSFCEQGHMTPTDLDAVPRRRLTTL